MPRFRLHNRHQAHECRVIFAAWNGTASPLRQQAAVSSCPMGGHEIWWDVAAANAEEALGQLPHYVAERTTAIQISDVEIP
jgi:hypothetical protein